MRTLVVALLLGSIAAPVMAQSSPQTIPAVITTCAPIISAEYDGDDSKWGTCIAATGDFLTYTYGPPPTAADPDAVTADLVYELAKLYRPQDCPKHVTELPDAIKLAVSYTTDADQKKLIEDIATKIASCAAIETASIGNGEPVSGN